MRPLNTKHSPSQIWAQELLLTHIYSITLYSDECKRPWSHVPWFYHVDSHDCSALITRAVGQFALMFSVLLGLGGEDGAFENYAINLLLSQGIPNIVYESAYDSLILLICMRVCTCENHHYSPAVATCPLHSIFVGRKPLRCPKMACVRAARFTSEGNIAWALVDVDVSHRVVCLQDPEMIELYGKIAWLTIIMWSFYPVVWLFSEGFASFSVSFEVSHDKACQALRSTDMTWNYQHDSSTNLQKSGLRSSSLGTLLS